MPRTRSIKPEFWSDEKLAKVSRDARLLFVGLWTVSDDHAVCKAHPVWLKSQLFPYDDVKISTFSKWLKELEDLGFIVPFTHHNENFYYIANFLKHQKIDHPSKRIYPAPPVDILSNQSRDTREDSRDPRGETETEAKTETEAEAVSPSTTTSDFPKWLKTIKDNLAYQGIDVDRELAKCQAKCSAIGEKFTKKKLVNWLNLIEPPAQRPQSEKKNKPSLKVIRKDGSVVTLDEIINEKDTDGLISATASSLTG
jgi:hypothetical protein